MRVLRIDPAIQRGDGKVKGRSPRGPSPRPSHETSSRAMDLSWRFPPGTPVMDQRVNRDFSPIDTIPPGGGSKSLRIADYPFLIADL
jgi:hypothetical protein